MSLAIQSYVLNVPGKPLCKRPVAPSSFKRIFLAFGGKIRRRNFGFQRRNALYATMSTTRASVNQTRELSLLQLGTTSDRNAPLLVYLPGADGTGMAITPQLPGLLQLGFDVRALHIPVSDRSSWDDLAATTASLLAAALSSKSQGQRIFLLAESFGACLALRVALRSPELLGHLVLVNPGTCFARSYWGVPSLVAATNLLSLFPRPLYEMSQAIMVPFLIDRSKVRPEDTQSLMSMMAMSTAAVDEWGKILETHLAKEDNSSSGGAITATSDPPPAQWPVHLPAATAAWRLQLLKDGDLPDESLAQIRVPSLVIASAEDRMLPAMSEAARLQSVMPQASRVILPDSSHTALLEHDVHLAEILRDNQFLPEVLLPNLADLPNLEDAVETTETAHEVPLGDGVSDQSSHLSNGAVPAGSVKDDGVGMGRDGVDRDAVSVECSTSEAGSSSEEAGSNSSELRDQQSESHTTEDAKDTDEQAETVLFGVLVEGARKVTAVKSKPGRHRTVETPFQPPKPTSDPPKLCSEEEAEEVEGAVEQEVQVLECDITSAPKVKIQTRDLPVSIEDMQRWASNAVMHFSQYVAENQGAPRGGTPLDRNNTEEQVTAEATSSGPAPQSASSTTNSVIATIKTVTKYRPPGQAGESATSSSPPSPDAPSMRPQGSPDAQSGNNAISCSANNAMTTATVSQASATIERRQAAVAAPSDGNPFLPAAVTNTLLETAEKQLLSQVFNDVAASNGTLQMPSIPAIPPAQILLGPSANPAPSSSSPYATSAELEQTKSENQVVSETASPIPSATGRRAETPPMQTPVNSHGSAKGNGSGSPGRRTKETRDGPTSETTSASESAGPGRQGQRAVDPAFEEAIRLLAPWRALVSPVVLGEEHLPALSEDPRPMLFVGNHTLFGFYDTPLLLMELYLRGFKVRGLAHHLHWKTPIGPFFEKFGAVKVSPRSMYRLLKNKEPILLFPGGAREVAKRKGEAYQLFWREDVDFVRLAAKMNAVIIPFATVGGDDAYELMMDVDEMMAHPLLGPLGRRFANLVDPSLPAADLLMPIAKLPGLGGPTPVPLPNLERLYFKFMPPIDTSTCNTKCGEECQAVYNTVKAAVREGIVELRAYQKADPQRYVGPRVMDQLAHLLPAFDLIKF